MNAWQLDIPGFLQRVSTAWIASVCVRAREIMRAKPVKAGIGRRRRRRRRCRRRLVEGRGHDSESKGSDICSHVITPDCSSSRIQRRIVHEERERERERHLRSRSISRDLWIIARLIPARGENLSPNRWREDATRIRSMTWRISTDLGLLKIGNHRIWRKMIHRPTDGTEILKFLLKGPGI